MAAYEDKYSDNKPDGNNWRSRLYEVIFEADTPAGKNFDIILIVSILLSVVAVMLDSVKSFRLANGDLLYNIEWFFTIIFTIEYLLRMLCVKSKTRYAISLFGIVDLLAIMPTYLSLFLPGSQFLLVIRILRVLRIFRILKLVKFLDEAELLITALKASRRKITVFLFTVLTLVVILGSVMYLIEGEENGFTSIPMSIHWAIVTLTTVGYGDIVPKTPLGITLSSVVMIIGYSIIAVPTGIVTAEISLASMEEREKMAKKPMCNNCGNDKNDSDARFCKHCGTKL
ncbi:MAG: voltage-gated potassium channel [Methanolobus sp.]|jgi:voltage-gated potassium channel|uniref:ion transporter n=1 Tax=Methanolobus sp. TaxID=1874737 RepID=UPI002589C371|nr:ion transporter [Methanolobus sp.]MDK2831377.1 voltage-gated potassium channel [Methanolobus sp.]